MYYVSTRGGVKPVSFSRAVMMGLATDGGLLLPETIPTLDQAILRAWAGLSFTDLAVQVMLPYVGDDLTREELTGLVQRSYATFSHPEITPMVQAGRHRILELFHGPTAAFKDVALQFLGNLFEFLLDRQGGQLNILGATSGDTGSAAIYGVRGKKRISIFILHPLGRVSPIQERQMTTVLDDNVHNIAIRGSFDDGQRIVKELFNDLPLKERYGLGAVNSINWARVLAQTVYYFYAWGQLSGGDVTRRVSYAVPTGNFGDIFAGYVASRMGLPVERLILATNRNDILYRFVASGSYAVGDVYATLSPSMDIQLASNFERYLYYLMDEHPQAVRTLMERLGRDGGFSIPEEKRRIVESLFSAASFNDAETLEQIRRTFREAGYILDPHSAIGVRAAAGRQDTICLATAHPAKFPGAVREAIGVEAEPPPSLQGLMNKERRCVELDASSAAVRLHMTNVLDSVHG